MEVICLEEIAFYALIEKVVARIKDQQSVKTEKWISTDDAMNLLKITSKTTLQKLRDEDRIKFTQPQKKIILYDRESILDYLEKNTRKTL